MRFRIQQIFANPLIRVYFSSLSPPNSVLLHPVKESQTELYKKDKIDLWHYNVL